MNTFQRKVWAVTLVLTLFLLGSLGVIEKAFPQSLGENSSIELRYCGPPRRGELGEILRDRAIIQAFRKYHPCPSTGKTTGACDGWAIDHVIPLACGGCDAVSNMQWLPNELKNHGGKMPKDRWERSVYEGYGIHEDQGKKAQMYCRFKIIRPSK